VWAVVVLVRQVGCASWAPRGNLLTGAPYRPPTPRIQEDARRPTAVVDTEASEDEAPDLPVHISLPTRFGAVQVSESELNEALTTLVLNMPLRVASLPPPLYLHRRLAQASAPLTGANSVRILLLLGTAAVGETAALVSNAPKLPGFARAASAVESHGGLRDMLTAAQEVEQVKVAVADGTLHVVLPANVLSMAAQGTHASASPRNKPEVHHIATVENEKSTLRGGPWTQRFRKLFDKAGMSMEDPANKVQLTGHKGPHPQEYHEEVYRRLRDATSTCKSIPDCQRALIAELRGMAQELSDSSSKLYKLLTKGAPR
jgi:hypothetical protein